MIGGGIVTGGAGLGLGLNVILSSSSSSSSLKRFAFLAGEFDVTGGGILTGGGS